MTLFVTLRDALFFGLLMLGVVYLAVTWATGVVLRWVRKERK